jgi:8-hydroxy-5-deazaflavin:NADPH oxidoreductase
VGGQAGPNASHGTFADAAEFGQAVMNCTSGAASLDALAAAGAENLAGKVLIDVANPLTFETGRLTLTVCNTDSLGEQIQRAFPDARVVKTLNTMPTR